MATMISISGIPYTPGRADVLRTLMALPSHPVPSRSASFIAPTMGV